jgi:uncharacterized protein (DUF169 family)
MERRPTPLAPETRAPAARAPEESAAAAERRSLVDRLADALHLAIPPVGIAFLAAPTAEVPRFDAPLVAPGPDGRRGRVPAGCVFWVEGTTRSFATVAEDHGNCSVGSITHGWLDPQGVVGREDVGALVGEGWLGDAALAELPKVSPAPAAVAYGPAATLPVPPDVVLLRVTGRQLMVLMDGVPELVVQGKPQCHIVALAFQGQPAASVGCALSRARTGMRPEEMTCALPGSRLAELVPAVEQASEVARAVALYAARDARRFASGPPPDQ